MTTVINTPGSNDDGSGSSTNIVLIVILLLVIIGLFFVYALPAMRDSQAVPQNNDGSIDVNVKLPSGDSTEPTATPAP